ncbi:unnamed protein product, partial [Mycena citricolor]
MSILNVRASQGLRPCCGSFAETMSKKLTRNILLAHSMYFATEHCIVHYRSEKFKNRSSDSRCFDLVLL